jgi:exopolysaccharide biosynthesis polyprenyl glycosylphosphotransferase
MGQSATMSMPAGSIPAGSIPAGSMPAKPMRAGSVPAESMPAAGPPVVAAAAAHQDRRWRSRCVLELATADLLAVAGALVAAFVLRFGVEPGRTAGGMPYLVIGALIGAGWLAGLAGGDAYRIRYLGTGAEEYKRVATGTFRAWGVIAVGCYAAKVEVARGFVVVALPLGLMLLLAGRMVARRRLVARRGKGRSLHRVLVVGDRRSAVGLARQLRRERAAGFNVIGACLPAPQRLRTTDDLTVLGSLADVPDLARAHAADTVAVAASSAVPSEAVRRIAWGLEGSGVDVVVAPSVADVAGPRISVRPVSGLPLLHVDQPEFAGGKRVAKSILDRMVAAGLLVALLPVLLPAALGIQLTSRGPVLFRQTRVGRGGREFTVVKFRTMYRDAEQRLAELTGRNESDGLLFKIRDDPRITPFGRFLRRTSVDELPQLLNVVRGDMSLVGPRPLPVKNADFTGDVRRRLLVRPGMTGLWQVNGRSRLSWEDAIRLDLYYVENWSISLDLAILLRTVAAVVRGTGAC